MTIENTKLVVPKFSNRIWSDSEKTEVAELKKGFIGKVSSLIDSVLHESWKQYVFLRWTDDFFVLSDNQFWGKNFKRTKKGKEFVLTPENIEKLNEYINNKINGEISRDNHAREYHKTRSLCGNFLDGLKEGYFAELDYDSLNIKVYKKQKSYLDSGVICFVKRDGEITEPIGNKENVDSIPSARAFIMEFEPLRDEIVSVARDIINKLPKEYFDAKKEEI